MSTSLRDRVDARLGDPIWWNDVLQLAKTVLAAVTAWVLASSVLDLPQLLLGSIPWLGAEATTIAATGVVVLATGFDDDVMLISRLLDTAIGVGVCLLVNVIVWPPLRRRTAAKALDRIDDS